MKQIVRKKWEFCLIIGNSGEKERNDGNLFSYIFIQ